jgi:hypothetical protein
MVRAAADGSLTPATAARQFNTSSKTVANGLIVFRAQGVDGLRDRSSRPVHCQTEPCLPMCCRETLRRQRYIGKQIAAELVGSQAVSCGEPRAEHDQYSGNWPSRSTAMSASGPRRHDVKKLGRFIDNRITAAAEDKATLNRALGFTSASMIFSHRPSPR